MTLPAAYATLSLGDINVELGRSRTATISLDTAENGGYVAINTLSSSRPSASNPAAVSEWYSYNHNAAPSISYSFYGNYYYLDPCSGLSGMYYGSNGRWYRSQNGVDFIDTTGSFASLYSYFDFWNSYYIYNNYYFEINTPNPIYWGDLTSYCAPY